MNSTISNQIQNQIDDLRPGIFRANNVKNIINKILVTILLIKIII